MDFSDTPIEQWPIENLIPYEKNNKKHPAAHVTALAASIAEHGVEHPIVIEDDGTIISGHGRRLALMELGRKFVPVRVFKGITKGQAQKLRIAANKTTSNDYDTDALAAELRNILGQGMTLDGLGLTEKEEQTLLKDIGEIDLGSMSDDIIGDVAEHEAGIKEAGEKADLAQVQIVKVFGFKTVSADQARTITRFLGEIEASHSKKGADALIAHMQEVVDGA